jgi:NAD(P) transhydrogenase
LPSSAPSDYDLVVIGSGPAGEKAAALAAYHGKRVAIVERSSQAGGAMVAGVATTKTMREAAVYLTGFHRRDVYGVGIEMEPQLAIQGVRNRAEQVKDMLAQSVADNIDRHGITYVRGTARLGEQHRVQVTANDGSMTELPTEFALIATGSRPFHPPGMPFDHPDVLDSDTAQQLERPAGSLVVIGGGAVACEYASVYNALGTEVTLVESRGHLLPFMDRELADLLAENFSDVGIRVVLGAGHAAVTANHSGALVRLEDATEIRPDKVIVAAGRRGNTEDLGLDEAGVQVDHSGLVVVDAHYRTTAPWVYAAGDVTGPPALASVSMEQGRVAACHAFGITLRDAVDSYPPFGVFSIPELAMVGLTEEAARAESDDVEVGRARLSRNARAATTGASAGMVKLVFRRSDLRLLGAHMLGDNATELVHAAQAVLHFGGSLDYFINATYNVPTESESFKYAAYDGLSRRDNRPTITINV